MPPASSFALGSFDRGCKLRNRLDTHRGIRGTIGMQLVEPDGSPAAGVLSRTVEPAGSKGFASPRIWDVAKPKTRIQVKLTSVEVDVDDCWDNTIRTGQCRASRPL